MALTWYDKLILTAHSLVGAFLGVYLIIMTTVALLIPTSDFVVLYALYALAILVGLHVLFISIPRMCQFDLPRNTPKYLEYIYMAIVSCRLLQIYIEADKRRGTTKIDRQNNALDEVCLVHVDAIDAQFHGLLQCGRKFLNHVLI